MAFVVPTISTFLGRFPTFQGVDNETLQQVLDESAARVSTNWSEADYTLARMLYTAHILTLDGIGTGVEAKIQAQAAGFFQSISTGSVSINRGSNFGPGKDDSLLSTTTYGMRYRELLRRNFAGIAVVNS